MTQTSVIRFEPDGPPGAGLAPCRFVDPAHVVEGEAIETGHSYFTDATGQVTAGVWECSPCVERMENYPVDEFCYVLKGSVVITVDGEQPQTYRKGDSFMIRRGTNGVWKLPETFRKYYVIFEPK